MVRAFRPRRPISHEGVLRLRSTPREHPLALGAGLVGLLVASRIRRRSREPRDAPWVLGLGF